LEETRLSRARRKKEAASGSSVYSMIAGKIIKLVLIEVVLAACRWILGWTFSLVPFPFSETILQLILVGIVIVMVILAIVYLAMFMWSLAEENIFLTLVQEGTAKIIVKALAHNKTLIQLKGYTLDDDGNIVPENTWVKDGIKVQPNTPGAKKYKEPWHLGGLRWIGLYPIYRVFGYHFEWAHLHPNGTTVPHSEDLDFILLKIDNYVIETPENEPMEDVEGLPLHIELLAPMKIMNPYTAVFVTRKWLNIVTGLILKVTREFVARHHYDPELLEMREKDTKEPLKKELWNLLEEEFKGQGAITTAEGNLRIYGIELEKRGVGLIRIDPPSYYREISTLEYKANQEKKRITILAEAEERRIRTIYSAITRRGPRGLLIRAFEAIEKGKVPLTWAIHEIPGMRDVVQNVFKTEKLTEEQLKGVAKIVLQVLREEKKK